MQIFYFNLNGISVYIYQRWYKYRATNLISLEIMSKIYLKIKKLWCYRNYVSEVHTKADSIIKNQVHQPTAQVQPLGYDHVSMMHEIRDSLNTIKRDSAQSSQKAGYAQQTSCPTCATNTIVLVVAVTQTILLIVYAIYK